MEILVRIYLSGPIEYAEDHGVGWRNEVKKAFEGSNIQIIDPCDSSDRLLAFHGIESVADYHQLKYGTDDEQERFRFATQSLIDFDLEEVRKADLLLTKISQVASGGTSGEITLARFLNVSILAFCTDEIKEVSGWVQSVPDFLFIGPESFNEALELVTSQEFLDDFTNRHRP
jgi:hypothetical protein